MKKVPTFVQDLGEKNFEVPIGLVSVPELYRKRSMKNGFEINVLIMGRRGLGSSTLVNSLFKAPLVDKNRSNSLTATKNEIVENGISLHINTITYHGENLMQVLEYIDSLNIAYFEKEQGPYQIHKDDRIHVCLYLIPADHLTINEIETMQKVSQTCNFIPIISKADMYTPDELKERKREIELLIKENNIDCYVPTPLEEDKEYLNDINTTISHMPFAVIASETVYDYEGEMIYGRKYPWGFIDIENEDGNDFKKLQKLIIYSHLDELVFRTDTIYYNTHRKQLLEMERNSESIQQSRYNKLKGEMEKIVREKYNKRIEDLMREENEIDKLLYTNNISSVESLTVQEHAQEPVQTAE